MSIKLPLIIILLTLALSARSQNAVPAGDTVLKGATIEVIQSYKPQVKQIPKPEWIPQLPPHDTTRPVFKYEVPPQTLYYTYSSQPLRPLALGLDSAGLPFRNYVKAGVGNLSTLFLDAGIGSWQGRGYETALHLHHISQQGNIQYQQSALSGIEAEGIMHKKNNDWHATLEGERNQYYYYAFPDNESKDTLRQTYTTIRAIADMSNKDSSGTGICYHPSLTASLYTARFGTSEKTIGFTAPFSYTVDTNVQIQAALLGTVTHLNTNEQSVNNNFIELLPGIKYHKDNFTGHALLGLAAGKGGSGYILPDFCGGIYLPDRGISLSAGWLATLRQNTYEQLTAENPYLLNNYEVLQTRSDEVFVNLEGNKSNHLSYSARISWNSWNDLPTFLNVIYLPLTGPQNERLFYTVYQQVRALSLKVAARYQVANTWSVGISGDFYDFYRSTQKYVWEEPDVKIKGDFMILPVARLRVTAYLAVLGGIHAENSIGQAVKLNSFTDLGGNVEYEFVPRLSAFIQVSNLLNEKYQRWLGYQAYGINVYGGLRLKF